MRGKRNVIQNCLEFNVNAFSFTNSNLTHFKMTYVTFKKKSNHIKTYLKFIGFFNLNNIVHVTSDSKLN